MSQLKDEINEKIPKKTQKLLIYVFAVLILIISGLLVFKPLYTKAMSNMTQAEKLSKELSELKKMDAAKETNKKSIEQYDNNTKTILSKYPRDIYPEDMIMVLSNEEQQTGIFFTDVSVEDNNYVTDNNDKTSTSTASKSSNSSSSKSSNSSSTANTSSSSKSSSSSSTANTSSSNSSSSNSSANASSNSSTNSTGNVGNSSSKNSSNSSNSGNSGKNTSNSSNTSKSGTSSSTPIVSSEKYSLYATPVTCAFEVSYVGVKQLFTAILSSPLKKNIESVDLSYDETTGNLLGTMIIDFYTLKYNDNTVNGHEIIPDVSKGTSNVFHTIR